MDKFNEITRINANSGSFDFIKTEPEIYSVLDIKKIYQIQVNKKLKRLLGL